MLNEKFMRTFPLFLAAAAFAATPLQQRMIELQAFNHKNILAAAEMLKPYDLNFRPTAEVRSLRELITHIADVNNEICAAAKGEAKPVALADSISRDELVAALKASFVSCDSAVKGDSDAAQEGLGILAYHGGQHYGNLVTYLRLKGLRPPTADPDRSKRTGPAPGEGMATYYMGFLKKGPNWGAAGDPDLQKRHLAHLGQMAADGKLLVAGPFADNSDIRGILIFKTASAEEATVLAAADPAVKAGRLAVEIHPWMVQKGVLPE